MKKQQGTGTIGDLGPEDAEERIRIGATIRALREALGATPDQVANYAGMSRPLLANVEAGRRRLNYKYLPKIAEYLGVPPIAIMRPEPNPQDKTAA
ncbi:helix-turn-helix domain-containing protein [Corynebacterium amycolatum]|uniref:helix-turn-helix domain-containing protein n=1 Tax=Corynebacterium amycolatum TaxID=43765 RepID=UPI000847E70A|nr:helix-turn-helix transcriptional regulator [Corynebacterium amycolatum]ODQ42616.1 hypothetical protein BGC22_02065 [Corynebacterium amycolatum]